MLTEDINPKSEYIDALPLQDIIRIMNEENRDVVEAVKAVSASIERAIADAVKTIKSGGSLIT